MILAGHKDCKIALQAQVAKHKMEHNWMHFVQAVNTEAQEKNEQDGSKRTMNRKEGGWMCGGWEGGVWSTHLECGYLDSLGCSSLPYHCQHACASA